VAFSQLSFFTSEGGVNGNIQGCEGTCGTESCIPGATRRKSKKALADANLKVTAPADVARLELFAKMAGEQIRAAGAIVGIKAGQNE